MNNLLGNRLRMAREAKRLTQVQVKQYTNIHNKTLSGYEKGVSEPDISTIKTLAKLYETSVDYLVGDTDDPSPRKKPSEILTQEVLKKHGLTGIDLYEEANKSGLTNEEAAEILRDFGPLYKKHQSNFVGKK